MSIDKYDVLRYAETLSEGELQLLLEQLVLIRNVRYPLVLTEKQLSEIPSYKLRPFKGVVDGEPKPPLVPEPPVVVWKDCVCGSWWKVVHRKDCKCGGGRFVQRVNCEY